MDENDAMQIAQYERGLRRQREAEEAAEAEQYYSEQRDAYIKELQAENERLQALAEKAWKQADDANNAGLKSALRIAELEMQVSNVGRLADGYLASIAELEAALAEARADAKRLEWAKNNPRHFYEICQDTLMSCVDEDAAIDAAREGRK